MFHICSESIWCVLMHSSNWPLFSLHVISIRFREFQMFLGWQYNIACVYRCIHACSDSHISVSQWSPVNPSGQLQVVEPAEVTHSPPFRQEQAAYGRGEGQMMHHPVFSCVRRELRSTHCHWDSHSTLQRTPEGTDRTPRHLHPSHTFPHWSSNSLHMGGLKAWITRNMLLASDQHIQYLVWNLTLANNHTACMCHMTSTHSEVCRSALQCRRDGTHMCHMCSHRGHCCKDCHKGCTVQVLRWCRPQKVHKVALQPYKIAEVGGGECIAL